MSSLPPGTRVKFRDGEVDKLVYPPPAEADSFVAVHHGALKAPGNSLTLVVSVEQQHMAWVGAVDEQMVEDQETAVNANPRAILKTLHRRWGTPLASGVPRSTNGSAYTQTPAYGLRRRASVGYSWRAAKRVRACCASQRRDGESKVVGTPSGATCPRHPRRKALSDRAGLTPGRLSHRTRSEAGFTRPTS